MVDGREVRGGMGGGISLSKTVQRSSQWTPEESIVSQEAQWTQAETRKQSQVDATHLVHSIGAIVLITHLHSVKSSPGKAKVIKYGDWMYIVMTAS